jgi:pimeloyl-ACP methyl ester carboxylesterase
VLVHEGWADASGWNGEVTRLECLGYPVIAPANPLRGLASDVDYIRSILRTINGPIVLVGHSYGGAVINERRCRRLEREGARLHRWICARQGRVAAPARDDEPRHVDRAEDADRADVPARRRHLRHRPVHHEARVRDGVCSDVPTKLADRMWAQQRPFSQAAFASLSGRPAWKTIPFWYLVATQDHAIPPATQMFMAHRAHATIEKVEASHVPMISHPAATTKLILEAANSVS